MHALVDGDIIAYRVGFACQKKDKETGLVTADPLSYALHSTKLYVNQIIDDCGCNSYTIYLTPKTTFRNKVRDDYKANRKGIDKPVHIKAIRDYLVNIYKAKVVDNIEADDALGLKQDRNTMICSIDKDLLMCEGNHYNFVNKTFTNVTKKQGTEFFYQQMLTGDSADNILGIRGLGNVKAKKILNNTLRKNWDNMIIDRYIEEFGYDEGRNRCVQNSQLLWILQKNKQMPMDFSYEQIQK